MTFFCYITSRGRAAKKNISPSFLYRSHLSSCIIERESNEKGDCRMGDITNEMIWQAIKELAEQLQQTNGQVQQLGQQVQQTNEQVQQLGQQVQHLNSQVQQLNHQVQQTHEQVDQLAKQVQQTNEQLSQLSQQVADMDKRLTDVANGQNILVEELFENKKEIKRGKTALNMY
ncbi:hypothetical protein I656_03705 [Geobacillus sp. WSUCF1]|nr:hypothetical protein I656_03705 [Geobacillus sp. WSUCF1]